MEAKELERQRQLRVVKSNEMIRKGRFNLALVEQRIVLYMISKIRPDAADFDTIEFRIRDFCEVCGIQYRSNISALKGTIKELADKSMWIQTGKGKQQTLIRWIEKPYIDPDCGIVKIRLDRDLLPYLINLKSNFTEYQLISTLALRSGYSLRLYELLKSYLYIGRYEISIDELKDYLQVDSRYSELKYFNRDVVRRSLDEINRFTDIGVDCEYIRRGRSISGYRFLIEEDNEHQHILARAYLSGKIPSKREMDRELKKTVEQLKGQISLFEDGQGVVE